MTVIGPTASVTATEVVLPGIVVPGGLQIRHRVLPSPAAGQALVRVEATGVSFAELSMRRGRYPGQPRFPFVPGYDLVPVPDGLDPAEVETVVVNGITAYQMLHRSAQVRPGQTVLIHGASGGVGTILVQLARRHGVRVLGTAAKRNHDALRALGAEPIDYHDPDLSRRVRDLAPNGVDAVFDHLGMASFRTSFALLAPGGTLVAYGTASRLDDDNSMLAMFLGTLIRVYSWNLLPNKRRATFYNFWAGHALSLRKFRQRQHVDLTAVLDLLATGALTAPIAATFPLSEAAAALTLAESRTTSGKVILLP